MPRGKCKAFHLFIFLFYNFLEIRGTKFAYVHIFTEKMNLCPRLCKESKKIGQGNKRPWVYHLASTF